MDEMDRAEHVERPPGSTTLRSRTVLENKQPWYNGTATEVDVCRIPTFGCHSSSPDCEHHHSSGAVTDQSLLSVTPRICRHEEFTCDDVNFRIDVFYQTLMENLKGAFDTSRKRKRPTTRASTVTGDSTPAEATSKRRQRVRMMPSFLYYRLPDARLVSYLYRRSKHYRPGLLPISTIHTRQRMRK